MVRLTLSPAASLSVVVLVTVLFNIFIFFSQQRFLAVSFSPSASLRGSVVRGEDDVSNLVRPTLIPAHSYEVMADDGKKFSYNFSSPLIFVGGSPRSGTTLMRTILDTHSEVHCGPETRIIPTFLGMLRKFQKQEKRLDEAGIDHELLQDAMRAFTMEIMVHQKRAHQKKRLCNKDPMTNRHIPELLEAFPNSKVIQMVRDGRAMVHSAITRAVTISGWNLKSYKDCLQRWNKMTTDMYSQCAESPRDRCLQVPYELLVQYPEEWTKKIADFLGIEWEEKMIHHEQFIGEYDLAKREKSTDQVVKKIYLDALSSWVGDIPEDVKNQMHTIAPNLAKYGYDPFANPPDYSKFKIEDLTEEANKEQARRPKR